MAHRTIRIGSKLPALVDLDGPQTSWPDKDLTVDGAGARIEGTGFITNLVQSNFGKLRAVALGYDTDWDLVRIRPRGLTSQNALTLGPGRVIDLSDFDTDTFTVEPPFGAPSTRLYNAATLRKYQTQGPSASPGWQLNHITGDWLNISGQPRPVYRWTTATHAWVQWATIAAGGTLITSLVSLDANGAGGTQRAADNSPDGEWSFADYTEAGLILDDLNASLKGRAYISTADVDALGNPGSNGAATVIKYGIGSAKFGDISTLFYGRLSLELWTDHDCPARGYVPRLAPVRYVSLAQIALAGGQVAPNTPIVTVPAVNVERAQFVARNAGAGNVFAQLIQPRAEDWIDQATGVADIDPASGNAFATIASGQDGAAFLDEPATPYIKLVLGADGAGATVAARSVLSLVRRAA